MHTCIDTHTRTRPSDNTSQLTTSQPNPITRSRWSSEESESTPVHTFKSARRRKQSTIEQHRDLAERKRKLKKAGLREDSMAASAFY